MISEIFLTPQVFSDNGVDAIQRLRDLKEVLFPRNGASPIVVTNLALSKWVQETSRMMLANGNQDVRQLALGLFTKIEEELLVDRSMPFASLPKTEVEWLGQASCTNAEFPLALAVNAERLNSTKASSLNVVADCDSDLLNDCLKNPRRIERTFTAQKPLLRTLCGHSQWMIIQFPFVRGIDDEYETLVQIFRLVDTRASWMQKCDIEIQIHPKGSNAVTTIRKQLEEGRFKKSAQIVRLASHEFNDRTILAGLFDTLHGKPIRIARWLIQPSHPAVRMNQDLRSDHETTWSFFGRKEAAKMLEKLQL